MDMLKNLSREVQVILGGSVLYLIFSFFDWQQVSISGAINVSYGRDEWVGIGVVAGLCAIALLVWELVRLLGVEVPLGTLTPGLVSVGLALLLLLFTLLTFITHNEARHWPSWIGLILSIVIAAAAVVRARAEGVQMPDLSAMTSSSGRSTATTTTAPEESAAALEPPTTAAPGGDPQPS